MGRVRATWLGWGATAVIGLVALLSLDPATVGLSTYQPIAQVIAMRGLLGLVILAAALLTLLCALLVLRRGVDRPLRLMTATGVLAAVGLTHLVVVASRGLDGPNALPTGKPAGAIDVLTFNTLGGAASNADVADLIETHAPDVVVLTEGSEARAADIIYRSGSSYWVFVGYGTAGGSEPTVLMISTDLGEYERIDGPNVGYGMVGARPVDEGSGLPMVYGVHATSPVGSRMAGWRADLELLSELCSSTDGVVMAGDFNATIDHGPMRETTCVDAASGSGGLGTWPTGLHWTLGARIDHVLVDEAVWTPDSAAVIDVPGSDHRAVLARLRPATS